MRGIRIVGSASLALPSSSFAARLLPESTPQQDLYTQDKVLDRCTQQPATNKEEPGPPTP